MSQCIKVPCCACRNSLPKEYFVSQCIKVPCCACRNSLPKEYFVSAPKAVLEMEWRNKEEGADLTKNIHDNEALVRQKVSCPSGCMVVPVVGGPDCIV